MNIEFAPSPQSTIGLEWEVAIVDAETGDPVARGHEILELIHRSITERGEEGDHPVMTEEFLQNTVEMVTGICRTVGEGVDHFRAMIREIRAVAEPLGLDIYAAGTHPNAPWQEQQVTDKDRYWKVVEQTQYWGRQMVIYGMHVHVGVDAQDKALPTQNRLLTYYPHLLALSANSPYWEGTDTGYASQRSMIFQQLSTAGLPWTLTEWNQYEQHLGDLMEAGIISDISESRLDIRPVPKYGTIEVRFCDSPSSDWEIGALAAFTQCLAEEASRDVADGARVEPLRPWLVKENKWRAARYGLDAEVIMDNQLTQVGVRASIEEALTRLAPIAQDLGCASELNDVRRILEEGAGYQRQRAVAEANDGDLRLVAMDVIRRVRES